MFAAYKREKLRLLRVYRIENNRCSCGKNGCTAPGKHPAAWNNGPNNGVKNASVVWDEEDFDGYNVGVATGRGLLCVDIDPRNDGHITWNEIVGNHELPDTWTCATGGGGTHLYFRIPTGVAIRSLSFNGVDFQYENKYAVLPPSRHKTGQFYEWEDCDPDEDEIAEIPLWLLEWMQGHLKRFESSMAPEGTTHHIKPHDYEWPWIYKILEELTPDCGYQNWVAVGMGLHATGAENAYELWDKWSQKDKDKYVLGETAKKWKSFTTVMGSGYTYRWLFALADMYGIHYGEETEFLRNWFENQKDPKKALLPTPIDVPALAENSGPLLKTLYNHALKSAHIPIPQFALASALQVLSGCVQGTYLDPSGGSLNLYQWCAAPAASGKDSYFKWVQKTLALVDERLVSPEFQSSAGFRASLLAFNSRVAVRDEFHDEINQLATTRNEFLKALLKDYKMLWNMPDSLPPVVIKASMTPGVDKPIFGLMGFSTSAGLEETADDEFLTSGLGSRFIFWPVRDFYRPQEVNTSPLEEKCLSKLKNIINGGLTMVGKASEKDSEVIKRIQQNIAKGVSNTDEGPQVLPRTMIGVGEDGELSTMREEIWVQVERLSSQGKDNQASVYRRKIQHVIRLACLRAISFSRIELLDDDVRWANEIVRYNIEISLTMFEERQPVTHADEQVMSRVRKVRDLLAGFDAPVTKSELLQRIRLSAKNLDEVLLHLNASGQINVLDAGGRKIYPERVLRGLRFELTTTE